MESFKQILRPAYYRLRHRYWQAFGRPYEILDAKRRHIIDIGQRYGCATLVETGTYLGDTVEVCRHHFQTVVSVELNRQLNSFCRWRFRGVSGVHLFLGDSAQVLPEMLDLVDGRALFWLDGHYSGGATALGEKACPVVSELEAIGRHERNDHIILIDDARLFGVNPEYPSVGEVGEILVQINPTYQVSVIDDVIHAVL